MWVWVMVVSQVLIVYSELESGIAPLVVGCSCQGLRGAPVLCCAVLPMRLVLRVTRYLFDPIPPFFLARTAGVPIAALSKDSAWTAP